MLLVGTNGKPSGVSEQGKGNGRRSGKADSPAWARKCGTLWKGFLQLPGVSPPAQGHPLAKEQEASRPGTAPAFSCTSALCVSNPSHPQIHHRSIPGEGN